MGILSILTSFNKISLIAFAITLIVLIYEISLFKKENKKNINIPKFEDKTTANPSSPKTFVLKKDEEVKFSKPNNKVIFVLIFFLVLFALLALLGFLNIANKSNQAIELPQSQQELSINTVTSKGIRIYDETFKPISENTLANYKNKKIIIGVETIEDYDIDRARIRINKTQWDLNDITVNFNKDNKVFYMGYTITSKDSRLKIEAQLHSATDGWLGD